uniref:Cytochrome P450 n=1 Tax=Arion vulgaris TaxID=1028688 RepID=A0A0B7BLE7_9EUPU
MTPFDINSSWILLVVVGLTFYWLWTKTRRSYPSDNIPPFAVTPLPIVGNFFNLSGQLTDKMKEWRKKCGDIYSLDIGGELHILVNSFNDIREIWVKHADLIVNTHDNFGDEILHEHDKGIFTARDGNWKEQRSTSLSILRSFGMGKNIMADKIQEEVSVTLEKLVALKGKAEDPRVLMSISVSNIICSVAVGKRFEHEDPYFVQLIHQVNDMLKYFFVVAMLTPFKQLSYLPGDLFHVKKWTKATLGINEMFSKAFINKIKKNVKYNEEPDSFVAAYLQEMKKMKDKGISSNLSEENLIALIRSLFFAGTETTSTTILWCLLYMLHNPDVQEKVYREIEANVGTERVPTLADKPKLTYFSAMLMETQRMSSLAPIGFRREVSSTFQYGGFTFPKKCLLWPVLDSVLHDKKIWGDPENFRPERFIDKNGALINREELIPFGIGRRVCLGESLAKMELFLFLSAIFQRFKCEPVDKSGELPSLKAIMGTVVFPEAFKLRIMERKV